MHSNLLHELIWILSDVKPNSAKFDSAITDLADIVLRLRTMMRTFPNWKISISMKGMGLISDSVLPAFTCSR